MLDQMLSGRQHAENSCDTGNVLVVICRGPSVIAFHFAFSLILKGIVDDSIAFILILAFHKLKAALDAL